MASGVREISPGLSYMGTGIFVDNEDVNVFDAAVNRLRFIYEKHDEVYINFSGGKDSTIMMHLALIAAEEQDRLPIKMLFYDEEIIDPDTQEYLHAVRADKRIDLHWLCLPARHTLASMKRPYWITWDPEYIDVWPRDKPEFAIVEYPGYEKFLDLNNHTGHYLAYLDDGAGKTYASLLGIRIEESFNRRRAITSSGDWYLSRSYTADFKTTLCKPIFDWRWQDVWKAITSNKWPYSGYYDKMWLVGYTPRDQRVAPWGNVSSVRETRFYQSFYPEFYNQALKRLPEMSTAARYGASRLYNVTEEVPPKGMLWSEYALFLIEQIQDPDIRKYWYGVINQEVMGFKRKHTFPIPEVDYLIDGQLSSRCWKKFCRWIKKGDVIRDASGSLSSRSRL